jgi:signal peptidase I
VELSFADKLGIVVGNLVAPGFAQAVLGKRRAALVWAVLATMPALLGPVSVWLPILAMLVRATGLIVGIVTVIRVTERDTKTAWWSTLSIAVLVAGLGSFVWLKWTVQGFKIPSSSMYPTLTIGDHVYVEKLSLAWHPPERGEVVVFHYPCAPDRDYVKRVIALAGDTVEVRCNVVYVNGAPLANQLVNANDSYRDYDEQDQRWFERAVSRHRETQGSHTYEVFQGVEQETVRDFPQLGRAFAPSCSQGDFYDHPARSDVPVGSIVVSKPNATACEPQTHYVVPPHTIFVMGDNRYNANDSRYWGAVPIDAVIGRVTGVWLNVPPHGSWGDIKWGRLGAIE